ncbi:MAG: EAL domain-containing protein [Planctomycetota bacterium]
MTAMDDQTRSQLRRIIAERDLSIVMQPIVHLHSAEIVGYEALTRVNNTSDIASTGDLFDAAARLDMLDELEELCRTLALQCVARWQSDSLLFMNNSPSVMAGAGFVQSINETVCRIGGIAPYRLVLEITERTEQADLDGLGRRIAELREHGFGIALDDVGAGISGLNRIMMLRPGWVKLDRELVADIDHDPLRQNLLRALLQFVKLSNMSLIAEGIERYEELAVLVEMGVPYGQGYFLAKPAAGEPRLNDSVCDCIRRLSEQREARRFEHPSTVRIATLARPATTFDRAAACGEVLASLSDPSGPEYAAVLDGRRFLGVVQRDELRCMAAGSPLEAPIGAVMTVDAAPVGAETSLAEALEFAAARDDRSLAAPLAVQEEGRIVGVVPLRSLLQAAAEGHRHAPSHMAALTQLPTRVQADQWFTSRIRSGHPTNVAFIDLREFDAYNLAYGFEMGDAMLLRLVGLIKAMMADEPTDDLLAHLGEDRFVVAFSDDRREALVRLAEDFRAAQGEFFSAADVSTGQFDCPDPNGGHHQHSLTTVRVVYLERPLHHVANPRELHELAQSLRLAGHEALGGIVFERRAAPRSQRRSA